MQLADVKRNNIQILRGIAIIAVVFIHNTPGGFAQIYCRPFFNFAVGLFLFLSGMLSNANNWNPRKRIVKVIIPYLLWTFVYVLFYNYYTPKMLPIIYLERLVAGNASAIMYYIFVYIELILLIPLIDKLAKSKYKYIGFIITPIEIIFMRLIPLITGYDINKYINISIIMDISCLCWFTYFYLGYLLGNNIISIRSSTKKLVCLWVGAIILQMAEGYWYLSMGELNYGTQSKLSSILAGCLSTMIAYKFINSEKTFNMKFLRLLGDCSFGIYFSHLAIMFVIEKIPHYTEYVRFPINAVFCILLSMICVIIGKKILGPYGKYLAL